METLTFLTSEKCQRIAKETLEIYAPIAHLLGIWRIMSRLEDLAFKHLYPAEYRKIAELLNQKLAEREAYCDKMVKQIRHVLEKRGVYADVDGRTKHIYSIYQKMQQKGMPFSEIRDLIGLRVSSKPMLIVTPHSVPCTTNGITIPTDFGIGSVNPRKTGISHSIPRF